MKKRITSEEIRVVLSGNTEDRELIQRVGRKLYNDTRKGNDTAQVLLAKFKEAHPSQGRQAIDVYADLADFLEDSAE